MERKTNRWKGFVFGMVGGAIGVMAMDYFQQKLSPLLFSSDREENAGNEHEDKAAHQPLHSLTLVGQQHHADESSTAALGRIIYGWATGKEPDSDMKSTLSYVVHWIYGILQGGIYGMMRAKAGGPDLLGGSIFGIGLWLFGDELVVPMLGLQDGPTAYSKTTHLNRVAMHLVYGAVTALTTNLLQQLL